MGIKYEILGKRIHLVVCGNRQKSKYIGYNKSSESKQSQVAFFVKTWIWVLLIKTPDDASFGLVLGAHVPKLRHFDVDSAKNGANSMWT